MTVWKSKKAGRLRQRRSRSKQESRKLTALHIRHSTSAIRHGATLVDAIAAAVVVVGLVALLLPGAEQNEKEARIAQCAANQKQLAAAALKYAEDFEGEFFYEWASHYSITEANKPEAVGRWWDEQRVGRYLEGELLTFVFSYTASPGVVDVNGNDELEEGEQNSKEISLGLGGGVFVCPADVGGARSYNMNFWASGIKPPEPLPGRWARLGSFFSTNTDAPHDQLLLFSEMIGLIPVNNARWTANEQFGDRHTPSQRFAGVWIRDRRNLINEPMMIDRFGRWSEDPVGYPTQLDYGRHEDHSDRSRALGVLNIAYSDGHVDKRSDKDLYDMPTKKTTYETLWSPNDSDLE